MNAMDALDQERRQRFIDYFEGPPLRGSRAKLIEKTGYSKGRVAQLFDKRQQFGAKAAAELARRLGLAEDAFERKAPDVVSAEQMEPPAGQEVWPLPLLPPERLTSYHRDDRAVAEAAYVRELMAAHKLRQELTGKDAPGKRQANGP